MAHAPTGPLPPASPATAPATYDRRSRAREGVPPGVREPFDPVTVLLEPGVSLVEASAGTGKTFGITLTVLRLLLDRKADKTYRVGGIGNILVVTFTNAATDELITRVRSVLRDAVDVFSGVVRERTEQNQSLFALLDRYGAGEVGRLREALASLDQLSIFTIHGFCKRILEESALECGTPFDAGFLEDEAQLVDRVAQDWWRRTIYEDERLAALAVHHDWKYDAFLGDFKVWRRWPNTQLDPAEDLATAVSKLDRAIADFRRVWDPERTKDFLAKRTWLKNSPLMDPASQARMVDAGGALAAGDLARGMAFVAHCTSAELQDGKRGARKKSKVEQAAHDAIPAEPFVIACDAVADARTGIWCALRVSCLHEVDRGFADEKARRHLLGFDDLLRKLRDVLVAEGSNGHLASAIRRRYHAALIDEFQDTDAYQFQIFSTAFYGCPLFLIGDPKQAIYGFRGADITAYMVAASKAHPTYTLSTNWRSTKGMIDAVNALFSSRRLDAFRHPGISFQDARPARHVVNPLESDGKGSLHWWFVPPADPQGTPQGKGQALRRIHAALVSEVVRLLRPREAGGMGLRPGNIAVLVRRGREGQDVQAKLRKANVPSVISELGNILDSHELEELECVLRAIARPDDSRKLRSALATELWGLDAAAIHQLAQPSAEQEWQALVDRLGAWREAWVRHGFMRMVQEFMAEENVSERLLAYEDGERRLTNLRHAVELLHSIASEERFSPEGLLLWITRARKKTSEDAELTELRLESDADAVQIVTIHKSKGLEYDVVFCPSLWDVRPAEDTEPVLVHLDGDTVFDHGSPNRKERGLLADANRLEEDLRLTYVALTRARFRCYVAWGAIKNKKTGVGAWDSALGYLLHPRSEPAVAGDGAEGTGDQPKATTDQWTSVLDALVKQSGGEMCCKSLAGTDSDAQVAPLELAAASVDSSRLNKPLPAPTQFETWRVSSFTSLTAGQHVDDPRDVSDRAVGRVDSLEATPIPRDEFIAFPAGRHAGVVLHELFEQLDFSASPVDLRALVTSILLRERFAVDEHDARIAAVTTMAERVLCAKLPQASFALRNVPRASTLREWAFDLPLGPIDRRTLPHLFAAYGGDIAKRYAPALRSLALEQTYGFLTGVVDLAFEADGRWYVVDWKSNLLGRNAASYDVAHIEREMFESHYVLQYHLYVTALHRFLRARLPGYDYDRHMGGVWYAFLRGIDGSERGWFHDRPPKALIDAFDALLGPPTIPALGGTAA